MANINNLYSYDGQELLCTLLLREYFDNHKIKNSFFSSHEIYQAILTLYKSTNQSHPLKNISYHDLNNWLKDQYRYPLLTDLIQSEINKLPYLEPNPQNSSFIIQKLPSFIDIIVPEITTSLNKVSSSNYSQQITIPNLTPAQYNNLLKKFLSQIDPSLDWFNFYQQALKNNQIIYVAKDDIATKKQLYNFFSFADYNLKFTDLRWNFTFFHHNKPYLIIEKNHTIQDLWTFIHEFTHFIQYYTCLSISKTLEEYSATTYELLCLDFLQKLGYDEQALQKISNYRHNNTYQTGLTILQIFNYMDTVLTKGKIAKEEEIANAQRVINFHKQNLAIEYQKELTQTSPWLNDATKYSNKICDDLIITLTINSTLVKENLPYIIGHFLANITITQLQNKKLTLSDLKHLTSKSNDLNYIFHKLGIFSKEPDSKEHK